MDVPLNRGAAARDALKARRYSDALVHVQVGLTECLGRSDLAERYPPAGYLLGSQYGHLVAAFDDEDTLERMEDLAGRIAREASGLMPAARKAVAGYREALHAMRTIRNTVRDNGPIPIGRLEETNGRVRSRIAWLEKVGVLHIIDDVVHPGPAPAVEKAEKPSKVPEFKVYFATPESLETDEQRAFYKTFRDATLAGERVDLEGNLSYAFALLNELCSGKGREVALGRALRQFASSAESTPLKFYAANWLADLHFLEQDFNAGIAELRETRFDFDLYVNLAPVIDDSRISVSMVDTWLGEGNDLTPFADQRREQVQERLQELLDAAHDDLGRSLISDLWLRYFVDRKAGDPAPAIEEEFGGFISEAGLRDLVARADRDFELNGHRHKREAFQGMLGAGRSISWPNPWRSTTWFWQISRQRLRAAYREAENLVRREAGAPAVGEGWVSEVALLNDLRAAFPSEKVVHQGRPEWLRPQSLDIFFPARAVAVEYQGAQHTRPVERFGGQPAFALQLDRDRRKRLACNRNGCVLIEVHPGYVLADVVRDVRAAITRQGR